MPDTVFSLSTQQINLKSRRCHTCVTDEQKLKASLACQETENPSLPGSKSTLVYFVCLFWLTHPSSKETFCFNGYKGGHFVNGKHLYLLLQEAYVCVDIVSFVHLGTRNLTS